MLRNGLVIHCGLCCALKRVGRLELGKGLQVLVAVYCKRQSVACIGGERTCSNWVVC